MPRQLRIDYRGAIHPVMSLGDGVSIFTRMRWTGRISSKRWRKPVQRPIGGCMPIV